MSTKTIGMDDALRQYLLDVAVPETELQQRLRERTAEMPRGGMQISPEQGRFMHVLIKLLNVREAIEIGTFTGYSAIAMASAMPEEGRLICCDVNEEWTDIARRYWEEAGLSGKITLKLGPAARTLHALRDEGRDGSFDLAFVDADKEQYDTYYEQSLALLRRGGVVLLDNVLWHGKVSDPSIDDEPTRAIRQINQKVFADDRVDAAMLPIGDGLTVARKR